jgi:hypothetical protein
VDKRRIRKKTKEELIDIIIQIQIDIVEERNDIYDILN